MGTKSGDLTIFDCLSLMVLFLVFLGAAAFGAWLSYTWMTEQVSDEITPYIAGVVGTVVGLSQGFVVLGLMCIHDDYRRKELDSEGLLFFIMFVCLPPLWVLFTVEGTARHDPASGGFFIGAGVGLVLLFVIFIVGATIAEHVDMSIGSLDDLIVFFSYALGCFVGIVVFTMWIGGSFGTTLYLVAIGVYVRDALLVGILLFTLFLALILVVRVLAWRVGGGFEVGMDEVLELAHFGFGKPKYDGGRSMGTSSFSHLDDGYFNSLRGRIVGDDADVMSDMDFVDFDD